MYTYRYAFIRLSIFSFMHPRDFRTSSANFLRKYGKNLAHKPTRTLKHEFTHLNDKQPEHNKAGVVYKLDCNDYDAVYYKSGCENKMTLTKENRSQKFTIM